MGICESTNRTNSEKVHQVNQDNAIESDNKIKETMFSNIEKCICKIIRNNKTGIGFWCSYKKY